MVIDKYTEFTDWHFVASKQTGEVQINIRNDNDKPLIAKLYNVLFAPDFSMIFFIITLINLGHTCHFQKELFTVSFSANEKKWWPYQIAHR